MRMPALSVDLRAWVRPALGGLGLLLVFLLGLWAFFPWSAAGELLFARLSLKAAGSGVVVSAAAQEVEGRFAPILTYRGVRLKTSFVEGFCREAALKLSPAGLLGGAARAVLTQDRGALVLPDRQEAKWTDGGARFRVSPSELRMEDFRLRGSFSADGSLILELPQGTPRGWDVSLKVPDPLDRTLNMVQYLMPLKRTAPGAWRTQGP